MRKLTMSELNRPSVETFKSMTKIPVVVVLDNVRSLHNVGSIFRTADAFNVESILLCGITATPPHREIHRSALGAEESVDWSHADNTADATRALKKKGYHIIAIEQTTNSIPLGSFTGDPNRKTALVFGNEINGIADEVLALANQAIEIPQFGTKHSFNVAVTAGIVLWEFRGK